MAKANISFMPSQFVASAYSQVVTNWYIDEWHLVDCAVSEMESERERRSDRQLDFTANDRRPVHGGCAARLLPVI